MQLKRYETQWSGGIGCHCLLASFEEFPRNSEVTLYEEAQTCSNHREELVKKVEAQEQEIQRLKSLFSSKPAKYAYGEALKQLAEKDERIRKLTEALENTKKLIEGEAPSIWGDADRELVDAALAAEGEKTMPELLLQNNEKLKEIL